MRKPLAVLAMTLALCAFTRDARACAPAPRSGEQVDIAEESAVIIWEPSTKTEHFIRRATFSGGARDFGFLVPTPGVPRLARVDDSVFGRMREKTTAQTVYRTEKRIDWTPLLFYPWSTWDKGAEVVTAVPPVEVLSTQKVGGYEAAILDATDAAALNAWLSDNGYATTPDLTEWLQKYVDNRWIISAFKIDKSADMVTAQTSAVRMSFTTDRPFFPYREPASQRAGEAEPRILKVWFIGPERVSGRVGDGQWPGQLFWSEAIGDLEVGGVKVDPRTRMTAFEDHSSPRPGTDELYFQRDADQRELVPPPIVETETERRAVPADLVLAPVVIGAFVWRRRRRVKRSASGTPPYGSP